MTWSIHPASQLQTTYSDLWSVLNREYSDAHPLLDPKFVIPLYKHFGSERVLLGIEQAIDGKTTGALLIESRGKGVWQIFLPSQAQIAPAVFGRRHSVEEFCHSLENLMASLPGFVWLVELVNQDPDYSAPVKDFNIRRAEWRAHATTINIIPQGSFEEYWKSRSRKMTSDIERTFRRLEKEGISARLIEQREHADMAAAVAVHGDLEAAGWKGKNGTAIQRDNVQGHFYTEVMQNYSDSRGACAYQLYFGDRVAASQLTIVQNGMLVLLKTAHDESLSIYSPGRLIDYLMLQRLFADSEIRRIEFYTNASRDDSRWTTGSRHIGHVNFFRSAILKRLVQIARKIRTFPGESKKGSG